jgi:hypothetical protein
MIYKKIYNFNVLDEIKKDNTVYCLDRRYNEVGNVNKMATEDAVIMLRQAEKDDSNRYAFWIEDNTEEKEDA